jgi:hypothetical protein
LILPDIHVVKLGSVAGLYLDLLSYFSAGEDPVALERTKDCVKAALFDSLAARQALYHLPMGMRVFEVHVEGWRIGSIDLGKSSFAAPEFHTALVVGVKDPHVYPLPRWPWIEPANPQDSMLQAERIRTKRGGRANVIEVS